MEMLMTRANSVSLSLSFLLVSFPTELFTRTAHVYPDPLQKCMYFLELHIEMVHLYHLVWFYSSIICS